MADRPGLAWGHQLLRVGLRATDAGPRPPASITFVIDVSGSMSGGRLDSVVEVIGDFLDTLEPRDQVGVVTFSTDASVLIEHTSELAAVRDALATLVPTDSTNTGAGAILGHEQAASAHRPGDHSSVVVLADGMANEGITDPDEIVAELERIEASARIVTHTVGIGQDAYNDALLERLANASGGTYAYIDGPQHSERLFTRDLPLLHPVAHDVKAQVEFTSAVQAWRLIGYENRLISAEDFRDDSVPGSYVGAGHEVTAIYELHLQSEGGAADSLGTVHVRWADPDHGEVAEVTAPLDADLATTDSTSPTWSSAAGMTALVEALRGSPHVLVSPTQIADQLEAAGSAQNQRLATTVRDSADAFQGASSERRQALTP